LPEVKSGDLIATTWANPTLADIATEITDSLSRSGKGNMNAPFRQVNGDVLAPSYSFINATTWGGYYTTSPSPQHRIACDGTDVVKYEPTRAISVVDTYVGDPSEKHIVMYGEGSTTGNPTIDAGWDVGTSVLDLAPKPVGDVRLGDVFTSAGIAVEKGSKRIMGFRDLNVVFETTLMSMGGLKVNNQATGAGLERVLTESDRDAGLVFNQVVAGAATVLPFNTTYTGIVGLDGVLTLEANSVYVIEALIRVTELGGGFKYRMAFDDINQFEINSTVVASDERVARADLIDDGLSFRIELPSSVLPAVETDLILYGTIQNGATPSTVTVEGAQFSSDIANTRFNFLNFIRFSKIA
jgi:hypothetical protein